MLRTGVDITDVAKSPKFQYLAINKCVIILIVFISGNNKQFSS